jgi:hypothetical protein
MDSGVTRKAVSAICWQLCSITYQYCFIMYVAMNENSRKAIRTFTETKTRVQKVGVILFEG